MTTVEAITAAIAELPPEQVAQIRTWLDERAEAAGAEYAARTNRLIAEGLADWAHVPGEPPVPGPVTGPPICGSGVASGQTCISVNRAADGIIFNL